MIWSLKTLGIHIYFDSTLIPPRVYLRHTSLPRFYPDFTAVPRVYLDFTSTLPQSYFGLKRGVVETDSAFRLGPRAAKHPRIVYWFVRSRGHTALLRLNIEFSKPPIPGTPTFHSIATHVSQEHEYKIKQKRRRGGQARKERSRRQSVQEVESVQESRRGVQEGNVEVARETGDPKWLRSTSERAGDEHIPLGGAQTDSPSVKVEKGKRARRGKVGGGGG
ncbi:hypothetical protein BDV93DRAFT_507981 [Ceratobasidium sp. AG-I]|nr:hypothetical protein BDV93DRAFT_507981 [Ceratobasidium sp. AG-I]